MQFWGNHTPCSQNEFPFSPSTFTLIISKGWIIPNTDKILQLTSNLLLFQEKSYFKFLKDNLSSIVSGLYSQFGGRVNPKILQTIFCNTTKYYHVLKYLGETFPGNRTELSILWVCGHWNCNWWCVCKPHVHPF